MYDLTTSDHFNNQPKIHKPSQVFSDRFADTRSLFDAPPSIVSHRKPSNRSQVRPLTQFFAFFDTDISR